MPTGMVMNPFISFRLYDRDGHYRNVGDALFSYYSDVYHRHYDTIQSCDGDYFAAMRCLNEIEFFPMYEMIYHYEVPEDTSDFMTFFSEEGYTAFLLRWGSN